jgi:hypothetical protein
LFSYNRQSEIAKQENQTLRAKKRAKLTRPGSYEESVDYFWLINISAGFEKDFTRKIIYMMPQLVALRA